MSTPTSAQLHVDAREYAAIEMRFARLLQTQRDVVLLQGESALALEAMARGVGGPQARALNVITSPYGAAIGRWLAAGGAVVENLDVGLRRGVTLHEVQDAFSRTPFDIVSVVHAEAATGALNPVAEIAEIAHNAGALVIVDAVASIGAEPLAIDAWDLDITAVSAQKALGGPTGVCAVAISERAWEALEHNPAAPTDSLLSLLDWRTRWIRDGRRELPLIPAHLETRALDTALGRAEREGLEATIRRHRQAGNAARAGLRALELEPWVADGPGAAAISTLVAIPGPLAPGRLLASVRIASPEAPVGLAPGPLADSALRINHTGEDARLSRVLTAIAGLALGLREHGIDVDAGTALASALEGWREYTASRASLATT